LGAGMGDEAPPPGNDEDMTHTAPSIAGPDPVAWLTAAVIANGLILMIAIDRMVNRFIDRWLRWQDEREARRREHWKRNMHRDQWLGIW
jgi:hypothetical protein